MQMNITELANQFMVLLAGEVAKRIDIGAQIEMLLAEKVQREVNLNLWPSIEARVANIAEEQCSSRAERLVAQRFGEIAFEDVEKRVIEAAEQAVQKAVDDIDFDDKAQDAVNDVNIDDLAKESVESAMDDLGSDAKTIMAEALRSAAKLIERS